MAITPRHYLDFINHYANLFHEKRSELEEQQMHLNVGLRKIKETVDQVEQEQQPCRATEGLLLVSVLSVLCSLGGRTAP